ncbi:MAG: hypothetical protein LUH53_11200 [Lachnospiraceae bacterium]|nr:hypothetical protein [Lachnospiraceae bacterium]
MNDNKTQETKRCSRCGRILPLDNFRFWRKPYYRSECRDCEAIYNKEYEARKKEKNDDFRDNIEMLFKRKYKEIHPARILNLKETGLDIELMGEDEIFVRLMDCSNTWISNYGRLIRQSYGKYNMLHGNGSADGQAYTVRKPVYKDGEWIKTERTIYAAKTVIETFIVNPDIVNNKRVWHRGNDINDNYYKNLYPLTIEQYTVVLDHYERTGDDSEEYILKVMNDIRFKKKDWSRKSYNPTVCGVGYHGCSDADSKSDAYIKWKSMLERCYNRNCLRRAPQYSDCTVCDEWLNFSNFRYWYEAHKYSAKSLSLDKDILMKGNRMYCPEFCALVPKNINQLMIGSVGRDRGAFPIGVGKDKRYKNKYRAEMTVFGKDVKIGTYNSPEEAFLHYKEYKESFIKKVAEQNKGKIPFTVYDALKNWQVEITD